LHLLQQFIGKDNFQRTISKTCHSGYGAVDPCVISEYKRAWTPNSILFHGTIEYVVRDGIVDGTLHTERTGSIPIACPCVPATELCNTYNDSQVLSGVCIDHHPTPIPAITTLFATSTLLVRTFGSLNPQNRGVCPYRLHRLYLDACVQSSAQPIFLIQLFIYSCVANFTKLASPLEIFSKFFSTPCKSCRFAKKKISLYVMCVWP